MMKRKNDPRTRSKDPAKCKAEIQPGRNREPLEGYVTYVAKGTSCTRLGVVFGSRVPLPAKFVGVAYYRPRRLGKGEEQIADGNLFFVLGEVVYSVGRKVRGVKVGDRIRDRFKADDVLNEMARLLVQGPGHGG